MTNKSALLVIDVQQALCDGEYQVFEAKQIIAKINQVIKKARAAKTLVVFVQHESVDGPLDFGTDGWRLATGLDARETDVILGKKTPDSFLRTGLERLLNTHKVSSVVICGLQSEFCIDTTTRRALALGYPVQLLADAHSTLDTALLSAAQITEHHNWVLSNITSFGPRAELVNCADISFESA
jgi:nicotinamidase-related amidase